MVHTLSKEALHIPNQRLLQVLKTFENALELQLKYITGDRAWNNFCVCLDQCSRDQNLITTLRLRHHQTLRLEDFKIWAFGQIFFECCHHFWVEFFLFSGIFSNMFWLFLTCKYYKQKLLEF